MIPGPGRPREVDRWRSKPHRRGVCPQGHVMTDENTYVRPTGHEQCRACHRIQERERYRAGRAA